VTTKTVQGFGVRREFFAHHAAFLVLIALFVVSASISSAFLTLNYNMNMIRQAAPVGIAAIGVTYVMILGEVDLSIGAIVSASLIVCAALMNGEVANIPLAVIATCLMGVAVGCINGMLIAYARVSSFSLTLGTAITIVGVTQMYTGGTATGVVAPGFREFLNMRLWGAVPVLALVFLVLAAIGIIYQNTSIFGRRLYLCGSNRSAAILSGIPVKRTLVGAYALSGLFGALGGIALVARSGVSSTTAGQGLEFQVLAAVVLGGTIFEGGRGGIGGTIAGCLILVIAFNLVNITGLNVYLQQVVMGVIIIAASTIHGRLS
jgi:ribose/xylose/arabinose/galactoside ABC-type transport system permease subunit